MPIELPPALFGIDLPEIPSDPPTLDDVIQARSYQADVNVAFASRMENAPTEADAAKAELYKTSILIAHSAADAAPAWFLPAMEGLLAPMREEILGLRTEIGELRAELTAEIADVRTEIANVKTGLARLETDITRVTITVAQSRNSQLTSSNGKVVPFVPVPFNDGNMPPAELTALTSVTTIRALNANQSTTYAAGYNLGNIATLPARRRAIGKAIGCALPI